MVRRKKQSKLSSARHLIAKLNPKSPISEQYRTLRTNLDFSSVDEKLQTILVTSAGPSEGKSSTISNLAVVYAQQGKRVLLVDADLRKPTMHYTFRMDNLRGLSNILVGDTTIEDATADGGVAGLDIIGCGPIPPNPSELLGSKRMEKFIADARERYDVILFDAPPVLAVTDAQILANNCDGSLLVIRSKKTDIEGAKKSIEALKPAKAKLLGTVLNDREKKAANYYYYYGNN
ncbi:polysaccharide biosynthesis tyrosine autokinase [Ornithinibacillus sp. L9]|uniref:non-specific protein-tyrosine kinase n=1 Tax=Ornithinibacillus caprae TaxID=2678566 RepID=A0A6N8FGL0_9BACI|nr:CpsD/CapB family tyrosine-protein kinase [Ornithinibacillus caprae]MUK87404.1 polysaccharide biosynthesis tyrosine autokinase [Ornithinibacillus caprae]